MKKNKKIADIGLKLELCEPVLGIRTDSDWLDMLHYADVSAISRIKNEKIGIRPEHILSISNRLGVDPEIFFHPPRIFGNKIGLERAQIDHIMHNYRRLHEVEKLKISEGDINILRTVDGSYLALSIARELDNIDELSICIEKFLVEPYDMSLSACKVTQIDNAVSGDNPTGWLTCRSGRIYISVRYYNTNYPDSTFLLYPIVIAKDRSIFSGLYMDINPEPQKQIYCKRIVFLGVDSIDLQDRSYHHGTEQYILWRSLLEFPIATDNYKVIAGLSDEYIAALKSAVNVIRKM
jgi:hypothetical protein